MGYTPVERNYDGIQHESIRKALDPDFTAEHDKLSAAYYGGGVYTAPDGSVYDFRAGRTPANKALFDKLHGLVMTHEYNVAFDAYNRSLPAKDQAKETVEKQEAALKQAEADLDAARQRAAAPLDKPAA